jgi:hypothetical protein
MGIASHHFTDDALTSVVINHYQSPRADLATGWPIGRAAS